MQVFSSAQITGPSAGGLKRMRWTLRELILATWPEKLRTWAKRLALQFEWPARPCSAGS
jgi:hypothetical protein